MSRQLPATPNPEHLRKEAKSILKAHRSGDSSCCGVLRNLQHLTHKSDDEILETKTSLAAVQFALAMDYGFTTWSELMAEVGALLGANAEMDLGGIDDERFARARAVADGDKAWLEPIPRYPYTARVVDEQGNTLRYELEQALHGRMDGKVYCAKNMRGAGVSWPEVAAASGEAFRFAYEPRWAQDAEYISDIDEFALACDTLGFVYTWSSGEGLQESLALIDGALAAGQAALITGWGDRFWQVVVGVEPGAGLYRCIGGVAFEDGIPMGDVRPGERMSARMQLADCPSRPTPTTGWHGAFIGPEQVAANPVFVVGERTPVSEGDRIRRTLETALHMNEPRVIQRVNMGIREKAIAAGPPGHDGWKFSFSPWDGEFTMGSEGIRAWANDIAAMDEPTVDFEMVHGIDTTFGGMMAARAKDAVAWLRWAEPRVSPQAREHLRNARSGFTEIARVTISDLGLWRTVPCTYDEPLPEQTQQSLLAMVNSQPALIYLITAEEKEMLGERGASAPGSPWGWRVLPTAEMFERGKAMVVANLRRIADVRDAAFAELASALEAL